MLLKQAPMPNPRTSNDGTRTSTLILVPWASTVAHTPATPGQAQQQQAAPPHPGAAGPGSPAPAQRNEHVRYERVPERNDKGARPCRLPPGGALAPAGPAAGRGPVRDPPRRIARLLGPAGGQLRLGLAAAVVPGEQERGGQDKDTGGRDRGAWSGQAGQQSPQGGQGRDGGAAAD